MSISKKHPIYYRYWGKARSDQQTAEAQYHLLAYHSLDVAAVACVLLENHPLLTQRLAQLMQLPEEITQRWCVFLLGLHDLGKFAESFQQLRSDLRQQFFPDELIQHQLYALRHDSLGELLWQSQLQDELIEEMPEAAEDFILDVLDHWLRPVLGHHGWPPDTKGERVKNHFRPFDILAAQYYLKDWRAFIEPDFNAVADLTASRSWCAKQAEVSWFIAGIAVLCDWLGSDQTYFEYYSEPLLSSTDGSLSDYWYRVALIQAKKALQASGVLPKKLQPALELSDLFPFIQTLTATPLQAQCSQLILKAEPQLFILEDVTGAGKTEAALILAQHLMAKGQATGLYVGLPTMATANAMYERMATVYAGFYRDGEQPSLILSHSARHLSEKFQSSLLAAHSPSQDYGQEENISLQCNRWLADNRKKALLADIGIGTIDQALLSVMPVRHQSLRLLGLLNKVLILDEVHAYDAYTGELLKKLLSFHAALGGSVILLSATLTRQQRESLISAFYGQTYQQATYTQSTDYPLLTYVDRTLVIERALATRESVKRQVQVDLLHNKQDVLKLIQQAVQAGKSVCWIRNTVPDAREAWETLSDYSWLDPERLHLFHSRFVLRDRLQIEQTMLCYFGKYSTSTLRQGRVLIATQVVEQSLDLDFDVMVSDLAPIDLLIQRAGRLQRHTRTQTGEFLETGKEQRGLPVLTVLTPELSEQPEQDWYKVLFPKANTVYPHTLLLWRTAQWLAKHQGWCMPEDARAMLEYVYDETDSAIPAALQDTTQKAIGENTAKRDMGNFSSLKLKHGYDNSTQWDEEAHIATRLGEESHTIYLARWQENVLIPWVSEGRFRWELSSLNVSYRQLAKLASFENKALQNALQKLWEQEALFDEYSVILPLVMDEQGVWSCRAVNAKEALIQVSYCGGERGLVIHEI
ncbi:MAG: CRISPR-associated helicase/endonuclease Cas3 [Proteobacteria bacterium]|nr:MAG: CRISPR-associated helicase/endonuclease Cas3 [Pseudomonadota bacterium]